MAPPKTTIPRPNPLRNRKQIIAPPTVLQRQAAAKAALLPPKRACPNQTCNTPDVQDGICHSCGTIIDDSNIVSEVQFGETSSGAAVVQGSYVGEHQGSARTMGPAFKRAGGMESREATLREGRQMMQAYGSQLSISDVAIAAGVQIFKLAAMNNFIQGRRMETVTAVCLYSGCRAHPPCRVMLIDFADKIQVNVFKLGRVFKALHRTITLAADGLMPVLPEDLIWRFCNQLDFGTLTNKVAEDAVRIAQRMSLDWMVMGRRPSGVCGACIILAARMHNFRRTVTEVVYVVKVTTVTIQKRLEEFKITPSSSLTVDDFLNNEFLESAHDPPSFYEKTEEFQSKKKRRKRKIKAYDLEEGEEENNASDQEGDDPANKRQKTVPIQERRIDADGFTIPAAPVQSQDTPIDPQLTPAQSNQAQDVPIDPQLDAPSQPTQPQNIPLDPLLNNPEDPRLEDLVAQFENIDEINELDDQLDPDQSSSPQKTSPGKKRAPRGGKNTSQAIHVPEQWQADEASLTKEISEMVYAPSSIAHAEAYARTHNYAMQTMRFLDEQNPSQNVSMDVHVGEDEFADDDEVKYCLLSPGDAAKKEKLWVNANRDWLRKQQMKEWKKRQEASGPPKARRNRKRKPRIGEGQTSPANSPAEAAEGVLKARSFSKKINYEALHSMFDAVDRMAGQGLGSAGTSRVTSQAGSDFDGSDVSRSRAGSVASSTTGDVGLHRSSGLIQGPKSRTERNHEKIAQGEVAKTATTSSSPSVDADDDDEADESDYVRPTAPAAQVRVEEEEEEDWRAEMRAAQRTAGDNGDEEPEDDVEDYNEDEMGDVDDDAFGDGDVVRGFGGDDMDMDDDYD